MNRKDVIRTARNLAEQSGICEEHVSWWVWAVCREKHLPPSRIRFAAVEGFCYVEGEMDENHLGTLPIRQFCSGGAADFWEDRILARQEND